MKKMLLVMLFLPYITYAQENISKKQLVMDKLEKIEDGYFKYLSFRERREAISLINEIILLIDPEEINPKEMNSEIMRNEYNIMSESVFLSLHENVSNEISSSDQISMILAIGQRGYITSNQLKMLVDEMTFDRYKIELIKGIYHNIIDPVNLVIVTPLIDSSFSKRDLELWLRTQ